MTKEEVTRREFGKNVILGSLAAAVPGSVILGKQVQAEPLEQPDPAEDQTQWLVEAARMFEGVRGRGPLVASFKLTDEQGNLKDCPTPSYEPLWLPVRSQIAICSLTDPEQATAAVQRALCQLAMRIDVLTHCTAKLFKYAAFTAPRYLGGKPVDSIVEQPGWLPDNDQAVYASGDYFATQVVSYVYVSGEKPTLRQPLDSDLSAESLQHSVASYVSLRRAIHTRLRANEVTLVGLSLVEWGSL